MAENFKMLGNAALMGLPKTAFLSSRKVAPAAVMRAKRDRPHWWYAKISLAELIS